MPNNPYLGHLGPVRKFTRPWEEPFSEFGNQAGSGLGQYDLDRYLSQFDQSGLTPGYDQQYAAATNPNFASLRGLGQAIANAPPGGHEARNSFESNFKGRQTRAAAEQAQHAGGQQTVPRRAAESGGGGLAEQFGRDLQGIPVVGPLAYGVGKTVLQPLAPVFGGLSGAFDDIGEGFRRFGTGLGGLFQ